MLKRIDFKGRVVKDDTPLGAKPAFVDSNRIRFVAGKPEKIGGWVKFFASAITGKVRGLLAWQDGSNLARLGIGSNAKLYSLEAETLVNITPIRETGTLATDPFTTTATSTTVNVKDAAHTELVGDTVNFSGATAVGGITVNGDYLVTAVVDADNYSIVHSAAASSSATGGGSAVVYSYEIHVGRADEVLGSGYGVGPYGEGTYGTARSTFVILPAQIWTLDQWGQFLVANPRGGSIYEWQLNANTRAALLANAPAACNSILVTEEKHLLAIGLSTDKMRVEWCDQDDNTVWTPSDQVTAGGRTLTGGSELLFGVKSKGTNLLFSDGSVWTMTFIGGQDVFSFRQAAGGASGIIAPRSAVDVDGTVFWMGKGDFYLFDGVVRRIPGSKDIRRFVFDQLTGGLNLSKIHAVSVTLFSEIFWFFASSGASEIDSYVKVNYDENWAWDVGSLDRLAGVDTGVFNLPIMAGADNIIYKHESGVDANGVAMNEFITTSPIDIAFGDRIAEVFSVIPDIDNLQGSVDITLLTREYPHSTEFQTDAGSIDAATGKADVRSSGRLTQLKYSSDKLGTDWGIGTIRLLIQPGGEV